jgi:hypothetical protein
VNIREVYNGVICRGEAPWLLFPISGEFWDEEPTSETWRSGSFGEKPLIVGDSTATTNAQCATIAESEFHKVAGVSEEVVFNGLKDPILSVGDTLLVEAHELDGKYHEPGSGLYTLDEITYPLGSRPMTGTVRRKR